MDSHDNPYLESDDLTLSSDSMRFLKEASGWSKMLAIIGFCFMGLMVLAGFFMGTILASFGGGDIPFPSFMIGIVYFVIAAIYFSPILYLYKFSTQIKSAIQRKNNLLLDVAFENLKSHYKFVGILTIIALGFYLVGGIGLALFGLTF